MAVIRRTFGLGVVVALMIVSLQNAPVAEAAGDGHRLTLTTALAHTSNADVYIRVGPSRETRVVRKAKPGTQVDVDCQTVGGRLGGTHLADNRTWDRLTDGTYVHDVLTTAARDGGKDLQQDGGYVQWTQGIPRCSTAATAPAASAAMQWAASQVGVVVASAQDVPGFAGLDWSPGTPGEWSGDSQKFVAAAWAHAGVTVSKAKSVQSQCSAYHCAENAGKIPPPGAIVFWPTSGEKGQEAIAADDGRSVYAAIGADGHRVPISRVPIGFFGSEPAGWAVP